MKTRVHPIEEVYGALLGVYGPQGWWPVTAPGETIPEYTGGPRSDAQRFEVAAGAVLTQNTSWNNASKAVEALNRAGVMSPSVLAGIAEEELASLIRPSGYYNQKAGRLKTLARYFLSGKKITRDSLLGLGGVGPETADSILLYALGRRFFVVDAYTRRVFSRLGIIDEKDSYNDIKVLFEDNLPGDCAIYNEYHALIVEHGKECCTKKPVCGSCPIRSMCGFDITQAANKEETIQDNKWRNQ